MPRPPTVYGVVVHRIGAGTLSAAIIAAVSTGGAPRTLRTRAP